MRALLSVYDKTGLAAFASGLRSLGWELISSGNTSTALTEEGIAHVDVDDGHRVAGDARRPREDAAPEDPRRHPRRPVQARAPRRPGGQRHRSRIDLVVCNLYPFRSEPSIEMIDIGGPTMVRAAAKNHDARRHRRRPAGLRRRCSTSCASTASSATRRAGAWPAPRSRTPPPTTPPSSTGSTTARRCRPRSTSRSSGRRSCATARTRTSRAPATAHIGGQRRSGTTSRSARRRWRSAISTSTTPRPRGDSCTTSATARSAVIVKHANPCGVGVAATSPQAYQLAFECDERSAFGGIVAVNRSIDRDHGRGDGRRRAGRRRDRPGLRARRHRGAGQEAQEHPGAHCRRRPSATAARLPPDRRRIPRPGRAPLRRRPRRLAGRHQASAPTEAEWADAELAWRICGHVKSNAIVLVKDGQAVGIGAGQQNRVESGLIASTKAAGRAKGGACASRRVLSVPRRRRGRGRRRRGGRRPARRCAARRRDHRHAPTSSASPWSSPASVTSSIDAPSLLAGHAGRRRGLRRPRAAHRRSSSSAGHTPGSWRRSSWATTARPPATSA